MPSCVYNLLQILSRRRRSVFLSPIYGPNNSYATVALAFVFDAYTKYANGTNITVTYNAPIQILPIKGELPYDPRLNPFLLINVSSAGTIFKQL